MSLMKKSCYLIAVSLANFVLSVILLSVAFCRLSERSEAIRRANEFRVAMVVAELLQFYVNVETGYNADECGETSGTPNKGVENSIGVWMRQYSVVDQKAPSLSTIHDFGWPSCSSSMLWSFVRPSDYLLPELIFPPNLSGCHRRLIWEITE